MTPGFAVFVLAIILGLAVSHWWFLLCLLPIVATLYTR